MRAFDLPVRALGLRRSHSTSRRTLLASDAGCSDGASRNGSRLSRKSAPKVRRAPTRSTLRCWRGRCARRIACCALWHREASLTQSIPNRRFVSETYCLRAYVRASSSSRSALRARDDSCSRDPTNAENTGMSLTACARRRRHRFKSSRCRRICAAV